jgi:hypothetical protein
MRCMWVQCHRSEDRQLHDLLNWSLTSVHASSFIWRRKGKWWNMKMIQTSRFYLSTACIVLLKGELLTNEWVSKTITAADGSLLWSVLGLLTMIFSCVLYVVEIRDSTVSIASGYGLDDQEVGVRDRWGQELPLLYVVGPIHPRIQWVPGALSPLGKTAGAWSWPLTSN